MNKRIVEENGVRIAIINSETPVIYDEGSALDFFMTIDFTDNCDRIAFNKEALPEEFFRLRTGLAGEMLQKLVTYRRKIAIIGDFSEYASEALQAFIRESNRGNSVFFVADEEEALRRLSAAG